MLIACCSRSKWRVAPICLAPTRINEKKIICTDKDNSITFLWQSVWRNKTVPSHFVLNQQAACCSGSEIKILWGQLTAWKTRPANRFSTGLFTTVGSLLLINYNLDSISIFISMAPFSSSAPKYTIKRLRRDSTDLSWN